jgi:hypothetical protein
MNLLFVAALVLGQAAPPPVHDDRAVKDPATQETQTRKHRSFASLSGDRRLEVDELDQDGRAQFRMIRKDVVEWSSTSGFSIDDAAVCEDGRVVAFHSHEQYDEDRHWSGCLQILLSDAAGHWSMPLQFPQALFGSCVNIKSPAGFGIFLFEPSDVCVLRVKVEDLGIIEERLLFLDLRDGRLVNTTNSLIALPIEGGRIRWICDVSPVPGYPLALVRAIITDEKVEHLSFPRVYCVDAQGHSVLIHDFRSPGDDQLNDDQIASSDQEIRSGGWYTFSSGGEITIKSPTGASEARVQIQPSSGGYEARLIASK